MHTYILANLLLLLAKDSSCAFVSLVIAILLVLWEIVLDSQDALWAVVVDSWGVKRHIFSIAGDRYRIILLLRGIMCIFWAVYISG